MSLNFRKKTFIYNRIMIKFFILGFLAVIALSIPFEDQLLLTNSLIVGKDDYSDLFNWNCAVCDASNKPVHAHFVEESQVDVKCIVSVYNDMIVLAFRYTNTALNVWQDILYPLQIQDEHTCSNCKVQKAYNNMWQSIKQDVFDDLRQLKKETGLNKLHITGISLGGGLAVISYIDISHANLFDIVKVTTFGAPRVGNKHWAAYFDQITSGNTKRYVVNQDPIVVLPRCLTLLCTYRQTGIKYVCYENSKTCVRENEEESTFDGAYSATLLKRAFNTINDHKSDSLQDIMDHVNGYPKIYNSTVIQ